MITEDKLKELVKETTDKINKLKGVYFNASPKERYEIKTQIGILETNLNTYEFFLDYE